MHKPRKVTVLLGVVIGLAIVTGALAATLVLDDGETPERVSPNTADAATPTKTLEPTATVASDRPSEIPEDVWTKLLALPGKLRDDLISRFEAGRIAVADIETVIEEYENRDQSVRVGTVLEATDSKLRLEVYTTGERAEVAINDETVLKRGHDDITPADLEPDELVLVISMDEGVTAFSITAFGVGAP